MKRLLLIEDDASIRRFVTMALEELHVVIDEAPSLSAAKAALRAGTPYAALISDLMLPEGSAQPLIEAHARRTPSIVLSAGINKGSERALLEAGVQAVLDKPVALARLVDAVSRALEVATVAAPPPVVELGEDLDLGKARPPQQRALEEHFGGDAELFTTFRAASLVQLQTDQAAAAAALAAGDAHALGRMAHSLKSVLALIGEPELATQAARLESLLTGLPLGNPLPTSARQLSANLIDGLRALD